jgi:hypothetical protein
LPQKGGIANETVHLSFAADWSKEVNPLLKVQSYRKVLSRFDAIWRGLFDFKVPGLVWFCDRDREGNSVENGIMIRRPSRYATGGKREEQEDQFRLDKDRCISWGSYLAKQNQKEFAPRRVRYYGASQLPLTVTR